MLEVSGDFEIHITAHASQAEKLSAFATEHGAKFVHIVLDRGAYVSQPMLTLTGRGKALWPSSTPRCSAVMSNPGPTVVDELIPLAPHDHRSVAQSSDRR